MLSCYREIGRKLEAGVATASCPDSLCWKLDASKEGSLIRKVVRNSCLRILDALRRQSDEMQHDHGHGQAAYFSSTVLCCGPCRAVVLWGGVGLVPRKV